MNFSSTPITFILIAANVIFSVIGFSNDSFISKTILWPYGIKRQKQFGRFITSGFIHADWMHLFFNMFSFYFFGRIVEIIFTRALPMGQLWYVLLYFFALIVSDIPSYLKYKDTPSYRALGASGAVSAVVFAAIIFDPWQQLQLFGVISVSALIFAVIYIVYCVYMGKRSADNINHDAHLWGSLFGFAFTVVLLLALRSDAFPYILEDIKNPSIMGKKELGATLRYLLFGS